ncbi:MAG: methyl-accepting chemotaxis protein [Gammaproteobacteria bacterium]|nr:MAG: methyl-accepting chemotaxis protein [Gammaproteobacteria bacterium]
MKNRKQYLIDRALQYRLGVELMIIVLLMLVVPFVFYASFLVENQSVPGIRTHGVVGGLLRYHWLSLILFYLAYIGIVYVFVVYYSHRIAGPVHHFRRVLDDMAEGRLGQQVHRRKDDYFEHLGGSINRVAGTFAATLSELKTTTAALSEMANARGDGDLSGHVAKVQEILDRYTVASIGTEPSVGSSGSDRLLAYQ